MTLTIDVGLVEDDPGTRQRFAHVLGEAPGLRLSFSAGSLREARRELAQHPVHVMLVDLGLPDGSGLELIRHCRACAPQAEVMVVSMFADELNMLRAFEAGARGYILKDGTERDLSRHVMSLHAGGSPMTPIIARQLLARLAPSPPRPAPSVSLTQKESEILALLARGYTYGEVARLSAVSVSTIQSHVKNLYGKLEVHSKSEAVFEARQMGLL